MIMLLVFNSYAWFIYSTKVSSGLEARVTTWNVSLMVGDKETTDIAIDVDRIYPGMENFEKEVGVINNGEIKAKLSYQIKSYTLLGQKFEVSDTVTEEDLKNQLINGYPFKVLVNIEKEVIDPANTGRFVITVEWPFESGNDSLDTYWGEEAAKFYSVNPDDTSLHVDLVLSVEQVN